MFGANAGATDATLRGSINLQGVVAVHPSAIRDAPSFAVDLVLRERVVTLGSADDAAAIAELASLLRTLLTDAVHESE